MYYLDNKGVKFWLNKNGVSFTQCEFDKDDDHYTQLLTAKVYIKFCCSKRRSPNKHTSSYGYKHMAEKFGKLFNEFLDRDIFASYVSNGVFIMAAKEMGIATYTVNNSYNCYFNISGIEHY